MILIVYDPDIAVFAERCLHDGDASAINSSIVSSGNKVILRHCLISKPYDKDLEEVYTLVNNDYQFSKDDDLKYILDAYEVYKQKTMELLNKQMMDSIG